MPRPVANRHIKELVFPRRLVSRVRDPSLPAMAPCASTIFHRRYHGVSCPGNVGAKRVCGVDTHDDEYNPANEEGQRDNFIHRGLSASFSFMSRSIRVPYSPQACLPPEKRFISTLATAIIRRTRINPPIV